MEKNTYELKTGLAKMLKGGVIMDVTTAEQAKLAGFDGGVECVVLHGSAHIHAMCNADGLIDMPEGENFYAAGSLIDVRLF